MICTKQNLDMQGAGRCLYRDSSNATGLFIAFKEEKFPNPGLWKPCAMVVWTATAREPVDGAGRNCHMYSLRVLSMQVDWSVSQHGEGRGFLDGHVEAARPYQQA